MCDINKQTHDDAKQTNRFPRYQLLRKETNNINSRRRQLLGSHARFIENSQDVTNTNTSCFSVCIITVNKNGQLLQKKPKTPKVHISTTAVASHWPSVTYLPKRWSPHTKILVGP